MRVLISLHTHPVGFLFLFSTFANLVIKNMAFCFVLSCIPLITSEGVHFYMIGAISISYAVCALLVCTPYSIFYQGILRYLIDLKVHI